MGLKCPVCKSHRVRKGYRSTPFWSMIIMRFNLLCDNCNWEFTGFALPWTIPDKPTRKSKTRKSGTSGNREKNTSNLSGNSSDRDAAEMLESKN